MLLQGLGSKLSHLRVKYYQRFIGILYRINLMLGRIRAILKDMCLYIRARILNKHQLLQYTTVE